jgi:predicted SprT family Zn-dependent metalloprotease
MSTPFEFICTECKKLIRHQTVAVGVVDQGYICDMCLDKLEETTNVV